MELTEQQMAEENVARRAGINQPGFKALSDHMGRFGPEGVLESALHLSDELREKLQTRAKRMRYDKEKRKWIG